MGEMGKPEARGALWVLREGTQGPTVSWGRGQRPCAQGLAGALARPRESRGRICLWQSTPSGRYA